MIKLNIQRFADASQSITLSLRDNSKNPARYVYFQVDQVGPNTFNWYIWNAKANASDAYETAQAFRFWINGTEVWNLTGINGYNAAGRDYGEGYLGTAYKVFPVTIKGKGEGASGTYTSTGTPDGFDIRARGGYYSYGYVSDTTVHFTCAKYNFTSQPSISVDSKDETSIKVKWSTSQTCNEIKWYNGNTLVATTNPNSTSGTYTFTGLTANTQYTLKGNFKRADSGYTMDSNTITPSTDNYPYVKTTGGLNPTSITLGTTTTQTINIENSHSRNTTIYVKTNDASGTTVATVATSGTSATITVPTSTLYQTIPSSSSGTLYYYCVYDGHTTSGVSGTYQINGTERPVFPTSSWSYATNLGALTGNDDQIIIDNYSTISVTVDTPATSAYSSPIASYSATWGSTNPVIFAENETATLTGGSGNALTVTATDSRGLPSDLQASTLDISGNRIAYTKPIISNNTTTLRENGIDTTTILTANGTMYKGKFGANGVQNAIYSVKYYTKATGSSTWSGPYDVDLNNCSFDSSTGNWTITNESIHLNGQSGGFPSGSSYNVKLEFYDAQGLLGYGTYVSTVEDGTLARDVYKDSNGEYHEGFNGLADSDYAMKVHGNFDVEGGIYVNGEEFHGGGDAMPVGTIVDYDGTTVPSGFEVVDDLEYIVAYNSSNRTLTHSYVILSNFVKSRGNGTELTIYNGKVKVGKDIHIVRIDAKIRVNNCNDKNYYFININGSNIQETWTINSFNAEGTATISLIYPVNENDIISLNVYGSGVMETDTTLTVEKLN